MYNTNQNLSNIYVLSSLSNRSNLWPDGPFKLNNNPTVETWTFLATQGEYIFYKYKLHHIYLIWEAGCRGKLLLLYMAGSSIIFFWIIILAFFALLDAEKYFGIYFWGGGVGGILAHRSKKIYRHLHCYPFRVS
jgi:hypothetical protein